MGEGVSTGHDLMINCSNQITIGDDCLIGDRTVIRDSNRHDILYDGYVKSAPVTIGNHVWVTINVTILPGVTIGDGAVIAAGSVVTHDIPPRTLAAGVPAKVVRENIEWQK